MKLIILIIFCQSFLFINAKDKYKVVKTTKGYVRGIKDVTLFEQKEYYSFKGIPYAQSPIDELRYRLPLSPESWNGVLDTFKFRSTCIQISQIFNILNSTSEYITGEEDCLYLNVFTPDISGNLPVFFWIHGGAYSEGGADIYGPDFILNEDVILVTINYRLGPFGFLSLGTRKYSGNMGLKDQLLALKWVNANIGYFGGDKNRITIGGESTGAASVHLFTLAKANENLFQRSIIMSGSILSAWFTSGMNHLADMTALAQESDPSVNTVDDVQRFLVNVNASYLIEKTFGKLLDLLGQPRKLIAHLKYSPIVETADDDDYFFTENAERLVRQKNHLDTMFGYTNRELFTFLPEIHNPSLLKVFNEKYEVQLPLYHDDEILYDTDTYRKISRKIHDTYFGKDSLVDNNKMLEYVDLMSDIWFSYAVILSAKIQANVSIGNTFLYEFSVDDKLNIFKKLLNVTLPGAGHADELCYLFRCTVPNYLYENIAQESMAEKTIKTMAKLWTNFIKYGNPTISEKIKPIDKNTLYFFNITNNGVEIGENPNEHSMRLWDEIHNEQNKLFLKSLN